MWSLHHFEWHTFSLQRCAWRTTPGRQPQQLLLWQRPPRPSARARATLRSHPSSLERYSCHIQSHQGWLCGKFLEAKNDSPIFLMSFKGCGRVTPSLELRFKADGRTPSQPSGLLGRHLQQLSGDERRRELVTHRNLRGETATWGEDGSSEKANCWDSHERGDHRPSRASRGEKRNQQDTLPAAGHHPPLARRAQRECRVAVPPRRPACLQGGGARNSSDEQGEAETFFLSSSLSAVTKH